MILSLIPILGIGDICMERAGETPAVLFPGLGGITPRQVVVKYGHGRDDHELLDTVLFQGGLARDFDEIDCEYPAPPLRWSGSGWSASTYEETGGFGHILAISRA